MEREPIREHTLDNLAAAADQSKVGGRPPDDIAETLAIAQDRRRPGQSVTPIGRELNVGRSTRYRAWRPRSGDLKPARWQEHL